MSEPGQASSHLAAAHRRCRKRHGNRHLYPNARLRGPCAARANGLGDRVNALCSDLLSALAPRPLFDVILSSLPKHAGEPQSRRLRLACRPKLSRHSSLVRPVSRAPEEPDGRVYIMVSSDSGLDLLQVR